MMKKPDECTSIEDIRAEIDRIDQTIIQYIAERAAYVKAAAAFKSSESAVKAPERRAMMTAQRRQWATEQHLDPDVIERLFQMLVDYFVAQELNHWRDQSND